MSKLKVHRKTAVQKIFIRTFTEKKLVNNDYSTRTKITRKRGKRTIKFRLLRIGT